MGPIIVLAATLGLTWVLFILPQQRRIRAHQAVIVNLRIGDEVMTTSGMYGTITALDDETAMIEVAAGTTIRFARGAVARLVDDSPVEADPADQGGSGTPNQPIEPS